MATLRHLVIAVCLPAGLLFHAAAGIGGDRAGGQMIGLCYRDGTKGMVLEEILKVEGVPYARIRDLDELGKLGLKGLILAEGFDSAGEQAARFVEQGGVLLSLQPSANLARMLGLDEVGVQKDGYLTVKEKEASLISYEGRIQLFGLSKQYKGGENLAWLSPTEEFGGIIKVNRGSGTALVVSFDLAATFLTILQPESECGKHIDASNVEYDLGHIPQVDLIRRLLVGLFLENLDVPVLRKWYFPSQYRAMMTVLGDQDGADFEQLKVVLRLIQELKTPYTLFVTPATQPITKEQFKILADGGMEFGLHPNFFHGRLEFIEQKFVAQLKQAEADIGSDITGERPHSGRYDSVSELPRWAERAGVQHDSILGQKWWESKPAKEGYWVGTGLPYNFVDPEDFRRMDVLEIPVLFGDNDPFLKPREYTVRYKPGAHKMFMSGRGLSEDEAFESSKLQLDEAVEKYHMVAGYSWHPVYLAARELKLADRYYTDTHFRKCINYAKSRGIGLTGTNALNDFWRAREQVSLKDIAWDPESSTAEYRVSSRVKVDSLTLIAPLKFKAKKARISANGSPKDYVEADLVGRPHAMFTVDAGPEKLLITVQYD